MNRVRLRRFFSSLICWLIVEWVMCSLLVVWLMLLSWVIVLKLCSVVRGGRLFM